MLNTPRLTPDWRIAIAFWRFIAPFRKSSWAKAKAAAAAAVALDPELAEGQTSLAALRWLVDWDWAGAEKGMQRAIELNPASWITSYRYEIFLNSAGRHEEAQRQVRRALELEP